MLSIAVVLLCRFLIPADDFVAWGWRVPFLLSIALLGISLWMRLKLSESPVFDAMKAAGETANNPFIESFTYPGNKKRIFVALFGVTGVLTTIWYTAFFSGLCFLRGPMRMDELTVELVLFTAGLISMGFYLVVGRWSDRVGRKKPIIVGALLALVLLFPAFWAMGSLANPQLAQANTQNAVTVSGQQCVTDPFAELFDSEQTDCGKLLETLTAKGVAYEIEPAAQLSLAVGGEPVAIGDDWLEDGAARSAGIEAALERYGFDFSRQTPAAAQPDRHPRPAAGAGCSVGADLRVGGGAAVGNVSAAHPLQFDVDPVSYRRGVSRRVPAADRRHHRGAHRRYLCGPVVHLGGGRIRAGRCLVGIARWTAA